MPDKKPNFLESIAFQEDFPPFKNQTEIKFWWEKEVQRMIEFSLKDKERKDLKWNIISPKDNAERFKINCVLGNNWGGKSNLLLANYTLWNDYDMLFSHRDIKFTFKHKKWEARLDVRNNINNNDGHGEIISWEVFDTHTILDDFFKLSWNNTISVNKEVLNQENLNSFYYNIHNFLNWENKTELKKIFESYLNIENIDTSVFIKSRNIIQNPDLNSILINSKEFITDIFKGNEKYLKYLLFTSFYYYSKEILDLLSDFFSSKNDKNDFLKAGNKVSKYLDWLFNKFTDIQLNYLNHWININDYQYISEKEESLTSFLLEFQNSDDIINNDYKISQDKYFELAEDLRKIKREILNINLDYTQININNLNWYNRQLLDYFFILDLQFQKWNNQITFEKLSAWQKTILVRFTNIYQKITYWFIGYKETFNDNFWNLDIKKPNDNFLILIDEPDLHLHLDWQRQYIQKLIDVFSTLDSEIKLHFIIATHSPFIISDLPQKSLVLLENWKQIEYEGETFWANYVDIIKNGFFFDQKKFMGSFAEEVIWEVAQSKRKDLMNMPDNNDKEIMSKIEENIWDKFLKNNLVYFKSKKYDKSWY